MGVNRSMSVRMRRASRIRSAARRNAALQTETVDKAARRIFAEVSEEFSEESTDFCLQITADRVNSQFQMPGKFDAADITGWLQ